MSGNLIPPVFMVARLEPSGFNALGTAFAVAPNKIATAFHVVTASDQNLVMIVPNIGSINDYQDTSPGQKYRTVPVSICAADPVLDLCVLQVPPGITIGSHCKLSSTDVIPPGAPVTSYSFPHANHNRNVLTLQTATVGARILNESAGVKTKQIVLNTQSRFGQSGGPVFHSAMPVGVCAILLGSYAPQGGGILLGDINPQTLHQTTHAISAEYLEGML